MSFIRRILETSTRDLVVKRRLPADVGASRIYVSPSCGLRFLSKPLGEVDPTLFRLARELVHEGDVVWDVGANVGLFTFAAAHRCGSAGAVLAAEADEWLVGLLRRSSALQPRGAAPVTVVAAAIAAADGPRSFSLARRSRAANHLAGYGTSQTGGERESREVMAVTLDSLLHSHRPPSVVKIDVEGAELEVLSGARRVLETHRPLVLCEVGAACEAQVTSLLKSLGYSLFDGEKGPPFPPVATAAWNTIARPH